MRPLLLAISLLLFVVTDGNCQNPPRAIRDGPVGNRINCAEFKQMMMALLPLVNDGRANGNGGRNGNGNGNGSGDPIFGNQLMDPNLNQQLQNAPVTPTGGQFLGLPSLFGNQDPRRNFPAQSPVGTPINGDGGNLAGNGNGFPVTQRPGALSTPQSLQNQRILQANQQQLQQQNLQLQQQNLQLQQQNLQLQQQYLQLLQLLRTVQPLLRQQEPLLQPVLELLRRIVQLSPQVTLIQDVRPVLQQLIPTLQRNTQELQQLQPSMQQLLGIIDPINLQSPGFQPQSNDPGIQQASPVGNFGGGLDGQGSDPQNSLGPLFLPSGFVVNSSQGAAGNLGQIPGAPSGSPNPGIADSDPQVSRISASGVPVPNSGNGFQPGNSQTSTGVARRGGRFPFDQPAAAERGGGGVSQPGLRCPKGIYCCG